MDAAYLHLALNHLPIVGTLVAFLLLLAGIIGHNRSWAHAGCVALVVCAVLTVPVFQSGEGAEEFVEELPGASHRLIHTHEEAAEFAQIAAYLAGALALAYLVLRARLVNRQRLAWGVLALVALWSFSVFARTAQLGGQIRRPELQEPAKHAPAAESETEPEPNDSPDGD